MRVDRFLVRWFNFSYLMHKLAKINNLPRPSALILETKGRKSGRWHEISICYFRDGENYAVIASNAGAPNHPHWFLNLQVDPNCRIHVNWRTRPMRARVAMGDERERIWERAVKAVPQYISYQQTARTREIPVVVLEER
jgi:deazaflavin-dependent oxidoreductase (nitroreductase family)